jgi:large subunit ribosomal protein L5
MLVSFKDIQKNQVNLLSKKMYTPRLKEKYNKEVVPVLMEKHQYKNVMQLPKLVKICLNQGVGAGVSDKKLVDTAVKEMTMIAGQKAIATMSKKAVSNFKLREDMPIGCKVTLRGDQMYEFLDRLISVSLPRVRDFQGISDKGFDGRGNYSVGITEQIIFPEIDLDKITKLNGMDITFVTSAKNDIECLSLLKAMGLPFKNQK